ncbi:MAG: shikimate kinase [Deltaproteobacteria bacterium]|nr:shikimate kinase [Deltaproteobacteria bacterium]
MPARAQKNIALTGFMAVGKSVVGQRLAERLRRRFVDLDKAIEEAEGMRVEEIFARKGESYFRALEKRKLKEVLGQEGQVIATGGGAVVDEENLRLLKEKSFLICLTAAPTMLLQRSGGAKGRPLLSGEDKERRIAELLRQREKCYAQAHAHIDTTRLTVEEVVDEIMKEIRQRSTPSPLPSPSGRGKG